MKILYQIEYTNRLTGKENTYMNVGFESEESAQREIGLLKKQQSKKHFSIEELMRMENQYIRSWMVAENWKIACSDNCVWSEPLSIPDNITITGSGLLILKTSMTFERQNWELFKEDGCILMIDAGGSVR